MHERRRQLHALLIAQRQLFDPVTGARRDAEPLDPPPCGCFGGGSVEAMQSGEIGQLLDDAHLGIQPPLLRHVAEAPAHLRVRPSAVPPDLAGVRFEQPQDDPHGGRLPGAVAPYEAAYLAGGDRERQPVERLAIAEAARQLPQLQHCARVPSSAAG